MYGTVTCEAVEQAHSSAVREILGGIVYLEARVIAVAEVPSEGTDIACLILILPGLRGQIGNVANTVELAGGRASQSRIHPAVLEVNVVEIGQRRI